MKQRIAVFLTVALAGGTLSVIGAGALAAPPAAAVAPAAASAGCGTSEVAEGNEGIGITSSGVERTFVRHVPPAHDGITPVPLVIAIHGLGEGSIIHQSTTEYGPLADEEGFVVAFPQALGSPPAWNANLGSDDVAFIGDLLDHLEETLCVDTNRIHVSGFSMGGFMTSSVACVYADRVAAVAPVAGLRNPTGCAPDRPMPLLTFHGTSDTWVSYGPIPGHAAAWADRNGCGTPPSETFVASDEVVDITLISYPCGASAAPVDFYSIENGGHAWPGSEFSRQIEAAVGYTTFEIHATALIWQFFQAHPMPPPAPGSIEGRVLDAAEQPLEGIQVWAYRDEDAWVGTALTETSADGGYSLEVPSGAYRIMFRAPTSTGWVTQWWDSLPIGARGSAPHVVVEPGQTRTDIDARLSLGGAVEGTVTGSDGGPLGGAVVWVYADTDAWVGTAAATTDADGTYAISGIPAGGYRVMFRAPAGSGLEPQWWDGFPISARSSAPVLDVDASQTTADIDAQLSPAP